MTDSAGTLSDIDRTVSELEASGEIARADFLFWAVRFNAVRGHNCPEVFMPHGWPFLNRRPAPPPCELCRTKDAALRQIRATIPDPTLRLAEWSECPIDLSPWRIA